MSCVRNLALDTAVNHRKLSCAPGTQETLRERATVSRRPDVEKEGIWLIAPLISKLHASIQGKVLKASGNVLETGNNFWSAKTAKEKEKNLQKR